MLNKNANCYNIENNFKYSTVISTFSEHITNFGILSIDIWQLKCQQRQTNKAKKMANFAELSNFSTSSFWGKPLWNQKLLLLNVTARLPFYTLVRPFPTLSCFPIFFINFLELIFASKIKTMLLKPPNTQNGH